MNSNVDSEVPLPGEPDACARWPAPVSRESALGVITYTYETPKEPKDCSFQHAKANGMLVITSPDGKTELFRDNPVRYLVVEPDPQTGELRPAVKHGQPVYLYLCREQREP
jgi:hypothetical protein